ncbi:uncharacterized protein LOC117333734 [Pecten maximus]|uniref:uncharacterized protein LOC117333734 n=1 Tax=Pecten maximus TaxID=6579 RepID=UPI001458FA6A|nr:uncharacterized protein LOC117333734 [Pecten maximus]
MASALKSIGNDVYLYSGMVNDECRIKIKKLQADEEGKMVPVDYKGISMTLEQWSRLMKVKDEISEQIKKVEDQTSEGKVSWKLSPNRFVSVSRIKSKYIPNDFYFTLVDIRVYFMGNTDLPDNPTRYGIALKPGQWEAVVSLSGILEKELGLNEESDEHTQIMIECLASTLLEHVDKIAKESCAGCECDHPSQKHHTEGCLMEQSNKIDKFYDSAKKHLNRIAVLDKVLKLSEDDYDIWNLYKQV